MHTRPAQVPISPETVSQAGAGALLIAVAAIELWLTFWAAGWWHRGGAFLVAIAGATLLARSAMAIFSPPLHVTLRRSAPVRASAWPLAAPTRVHLAELAQR